MNDQHWKNEKNWGAGLCGFYFCKEDTRLWVPKKNPVMGVTINLGHPKGGFTLISLFLIPIFFLVAGLLVSVVVVNH